MKTQDSLLRFSKSREDLLKVIAGLEEMEFEAPHVEGVWTIKDLIGHITAWEIALLDLLRSFIAGEPFTPEHIPDHDIWNADQAMKRRNASVQKILQESIAVRQQLLELANALSDEQWGQVLPAPWGSQETLVQMIDGLAWHEEEHTRNILKYFNSLRG